MPNNQNPDTVRGNTDSYVKHQNHLQWKRNPEQNSITNKIKRQKTVLNSHRRSLEVATPS
jgi:hypothetical protein